MIVQYFLGMLLLVFAVASIVAGVFTAYFGSGKSRAIGGILVIIGLIVGFIFLWGAGIMGTPSGVLNLIGTVTNGIVAVIGAVVGAVIALGIFLLAIMKA